MINPRILERIATQYMHIYRTEGLNEASRYTERVLKGNTEDYEKLRCAVKALIRKKG